MQHLAVPVRVARVTDQEAEQHGVLEHREARRRLVHPRPQRRLPRVRDGVRRHLPPALGTGVGADQAVVGESAQLGVDLARRGRDPVEAERHVGALLDLVPRQLVAEREEAEDRVRSHRKVLTHLPCRVVFLIGIVTEGRSTGWHTITRSRQKDWSRSSARRWRSTTSASRSRGGPCSACSDPTARARRRRCG